MFIAALFTRAKLCSSDALQLINRVRKCDIQIKLQIMMLSEVNQVQKDKGFMFLIYGISKR
jgi:hypothetical protein